MATTRSEINCQEGDCTRYPHTGHGCEYRPPDHPACEAEATVAIEYDDDCPVVPFVCEPHAVTLEELERTSPGANAWYDESRRPPASLPLRSRRSGTGADPYMAKVAKDER